MGPKGKEESRGEILGWAIIGHGPGVTILASERPARKKMKSVKVKYCMDLDMGGGLP